MTDKSAAKQRIARLKALRGVHQESVDRTQALLKEQQAFRKKLRAAMMGEPKTIPEIAASAELPSEDVLWHVMAMKKYDLVREVGKSGDYYQYALAEGETS
jgi:predicted Rossmann fold nucleotide-binding protein DprA/Smf involved in DNA uptake